MICDIIDAIADNDGILKVNREHVLELMSVKKALEFYANEDNYDSMEISEDRGANARVVLWDGDSEV